MLDFNDKNLTKLFFGEIFEGGIASNGDAYIWDAHKLSSQENPEVNDGKR